jgi:hypothetical protein
MDNESKRGAQMKKRSFTIRVGPLGLSLAAAAITAVAFAAISVADSGGGDGSDGGATQTFQGPPPPGGGVGITTFRAEPNLSDADRQKVEEFKQCLLDNDAPKPPDPGEIDPSNPRLAPSQDLENLKKAWEACKDKLPEDLQKAGPPQLQFGGDCAAPPGAPGEQGKQQDQDQSNDSSTSSSGSSS